MKMKYKICLIICFCVVFSSCSDILDKKPLTKISENDVWNNIGLIQFYINDLYSRAPYTGQFSDFYTFTDEATSSSGNSNNLTNGNMSKSIEVAGYWDYSYVRDCCIFLNKIDDVLIDDFKKNKFKGEVHLMLAIYYFEMAKRYGGVPIVDKVLDPYASGDINMLPRNTEKEVFKFIEKEVDLAISLLGEEVASKEYYNAWAAYAFKARFMLWAASIAKYSTLQLGGLVGIPADDAGSYYKKAFDAATKVINSGKYALYNKMPSNKSENYRYIFLDKDNPEIIIRRSYNGNELKHGWDNANTPPSFRSTYGGRCNPLWELILDYENIDGSNDQPLIGKDHLYNNGYELFQKKDPRLHATVMYQGTKWQGDIVDLYEGIDTTEGETNPNNILKTLGLTYKGIPQVGKDSRLQSNSDGTSKSGFYVKKFMDESLIKPEGISKTDWPEIRLAELYLIAAESAMEMNEPSEAVFYLNPIRERAGITLLDKSTITLKRIRNERKIELAFENQRYWDLRRWRISEIVQVNNGAKFHGLRVIYHYDSKKFYFLLMDAENFVRTFRIEHYYNPITINRINNNTSLIENPNY